MIDHASRTLSRFALLIIGLSAPGSLHASARPVSHAACPQGRLPLYSHNDYRSTRPLYDALDAGFRGVEVDLFLVDGVLRPGHSRHEARRARTFEEMYLQPLDSLARSCRGAAWLAGRAPLLVLLEMKEESTTTYDSVFAVLERHRELFVAATRDTVAPIEVVFVGWLPPATHTFHGDAEAFFRRQQRMRHPADTLLENDGWPVRLISVDYGKTMGRWWTRGSERARWRRALSVMKRRSPRQLLRTHNVPPDSGVVAQLLAADVDLVGATNVQAFARLLRSAVQGPSH
jgi:hypothetical protein